MVKYNGLERKVNYWWFLLKVTKTCSFITPNAMWSQEDSRATCTAVVDVVGGCLAPLHWASVFATQCRDRCLLMAQMAFFSWEVPLAYACYLTLNVWKIKSSHQEWCAINLLAQGKTTSWCHSLPVGPVRLGPGQLAAENTSLLTPPAWSHFSHSPFLRILLQ